MLFNLLKRKTKKQKFQEKQLKKGQRTFIYCPNCDNELIGSNSFIKDADYVYYKCDKCGTESKWNFDFICPILLVERSK